MVITTKTAKRLRLPQNMQFFFISHVEVSQSDYIHEDSGHLYLCYFQKQCRANSLTKATKTTGILLLSICNSTIFVAKFFAYEFA